MNEIDQRKIDQMKIERGIADAEKRRDALAVQMDNYKHLETSEDYMEFAKMQTEWERTINELDIWNIQREMFRDH